MKKVDYIIVGCGLAGIAFCETLRQHNKSFLVFDNSSQQSSIVAAGMYNPVILKRFSEVWKAKEQLDLLEEHYGSLEQLLNIKLNYSFPILRKFNSIEEQNLWFQASDKPNLEPYLSTKILKNSNSAIDANYGFGTVKGAGRIDTTTLIHSYKTYLKSTDRLIEEAFNHELLDVSNGTVVYDKFSANSIVFAEGFGIKSNPLFNYLPLNGTKGEVITIKAPDLKINHTLKSSVFIVHISEDIYKVGATYNWKDKTNLPTKEGALELVSKLKNLINCDFQIIEHKAGIRPTVKDRRPLVGRHLESENVYVLNGLGTRGVMIAPYVSRQLYQFIENNTSLDAEIDIKRFKP